MPFAPAGADRAVRDGDRQRLQKLGIHHAESPFAPMPSASDSTITAVKPGLLHQPQGMRHVLPTRHPAMRTPVARHHSVARARCRTRAAPHRGPARPRPAARCSSVSASRCAQLTRGSASARPVGAPTASSRLSSSHGPGLRRGLTTSLCCKATAIDTRPRAGDRAANAAAEGRRDAHERERRSGYARADDMSRVAAAERQRRGAPASTSRIPSRAALPRLRRAGAAPVPISGVLRHAVRHHEQADQASGGAMPAKAPAAPLNHVCALASARSSASASSSRPASRSTGESARDPPNAPDRPWSAHRACGPVVAAPRATRDFFPRGLL